jgi:hypothetical protein
MEQDMDGPAPKRARQRRARATKAAAPKTRAKGAGTETKWSPAAEKLFLVELATSSNVSRAAAAAGVSSALVYKRRTGSLAFRRAWEAALCEGYALLEAAMLDRALNGIEKPGRGDSVIREYSDAVGVRLLVMHRDSVRGAKARFEREDGSKALEELEARLEAMARATPDVGE